jgi:hypothetical protein
MELDPGAESEDRTLGVFGKLVALGERRVLVEFLAKVLDQGVVQHVEEIVRRGPAVVLLRVEPAGRDIGVPRQHHAAARDPLRGGVSAAQERGRKRGCRYRRPQQGSPAQCRLLHRCLHYAAEERDSGASTLTYCRGMARHPLHCPSSQTLSSRSLASNVVQLCKIVAAILPVGNARQAVGAGAGRQRPASMVFFS